MRSLNQNFALKKGLKSSTPVTLAVFHFPGGDVFVSDRELSAPGGGPDFTGLVTSWGSLKTPGQGLFSVGLPEITLELANTGAPPFSSYLEGCVPEEVYVELFQWFEGIAYADKELIGRFVISSPVSYNESYARLALVSAFIKRNRTIGKKISRDDYPQADPDAVGRLENIVYGFPKNVTCPCIVAGGYSTLVDGINGTDDWTWIGLSLASDEAYFPSVPFLVQCENEQMHAVDFDSPTKAYKVERGYNGTTKTTHDKGMAVWEVKDAVSQTPYFAYLAAGHPVKSIGDVYVGGVRVLSGVSRFSNSYGKAVLLFDSKFTLEKSVDLAADDTISVADNISVDQGSHSHNSPLKKTVDGGAHTIAWSQNDVDQVNIVSVASPGNLGTITNCRLKIVVRPTMWYSASQNGLFWVSGAHVPAQSVSLTVNQPATVTFYPNVTNPDWSAGMFQLTMQMSTPSGNADVSIDEVSWDIEYTAPVGSSAATGVAKTGTASKTGTVSIKGNSSADVVVGGDVTCDLEGYQDDSTGSYTGSSGALIENPADVIRHFIVNYMDAPQEELDGSFTLTRTALTQAVTGGYSFAGVINSQVDALDQIEGWLAQARLRFLHDGSRASIALVGNTAATADKTVSKAMLKSGSLKIARTGRQEVINRLDLHYLRDYSKDGNSSGNYMALAGSSQAYPSGGDPASVALYGPMTPARSMSFGFVSDEAMASDLRDFYITRYKDVKRRVYMTLYLDGFGLLEGDVLEIDYPSSAFNLSGAKFCVEKVGLVPGSASHVRPDEMRVQAREV